MRSIPGAALLVGLVLIGCTDKPVAPPPPQEKRPPPHSAPCEDGMALVTGPGDTHAVCIDRWEATLVDVFLDGHEDPHPPFEPMGSGPVRAITRAGVMPQAYISRNEAAVACRASGKRLCKEEEWVRACGGEDATTYPYGVTHEELACNDHGRAPIAALHGFRGAAAYSSNGVMNDPQLNQLPGTLTPTGSHTRCKTRAGVFDMVGNLHEWVDDPDGTFVGGYYLDTTLNGNGCKYRTVAHGPSYHDYSTGFRCCADPHPAKR